MDIQHLFKIYRLKPMSPSRHFCSSFESNVAHFSSVLDPSMDFVIKHLTSMKGKIGFFLVPLKNLSEFQK